MTQQTTDYEINEKDIDTVLNILKKSDPENATPEMAIAILENMYATFHKLRHVDPELLVQIYEDLLQEKKNSQKEELSEG